MKTVVCPIFAALALTGCVSGTISWNPSGSHPANPDAAQVGYPPLARF